MASPLMESQQAAQKRRPQIVGQTQGTVGAMPPNNPVLTAETPQQAPSPTSPWAPVAAPQPVLQPIGQAGGAAPSWGGRGAATGLPTGVEAFGGPMVNMTANVPDVTAGNRPTDASQLQPVGSSGVRPNLPAPIGQAGVEAFGGPMMNSMALPAAPRPIVQGTPEWDARARESGFASTNPAPTPQAPPGGWPAPRQPAFQPVAGTITTTQRPGQPSQWGIPQPVGQASPITPFTATDNLRSSQINPLADPRLGGTQGAVDAATRSLAGASTGPFQGIGAGGYDPSQDTNRARQLTSQGLESLYNGPNRQDLAGNSLNRFIEDQNLDYSRRAQDVGRQAASLGRIGSGMTADDIQRLGRGREENIVRESARLADQTAGQEMDDRLNRLGASQGAFGQFAGQDVTDTGVRADLRGEARGERQAGQQYGQQTFENQLNRLGALSGLEDQQFGQGLTQRNELRGERGYQGDLAQQATQNRFSQLDREQQAQEQAERQRLQRVGMASNTGYSNTPWNTSLDAAGGIEDAGRYGLDVAGNYAQELGQSGGGFDWGSVLRDIGGGGGGGGQPAIPRSVTDMAGLIPEIPNMVPRPTGPVGGMSQPQLTPEQIAMLQRYYGG